MYQGLSGPDHWKSRIFDFKIFWIHFIILAPFLHQCWSGRSQNKQTHKDKHPQKSTCTQKYFVIELTFYHMNSKKATQVLWYTLWNFTLRWEPNGELGWVCYTSLFSNTSLIMFCVLKISNFISNNLGNQNCYTPILSTKY